jgi:hypothetical protein
MSEFNKYSVEELQGYFSDFHKDFYGSRPRFATEEQWNSREWLETSINAIHDTMDNMKLTFSGREALREMGWVVEETEPEFVKQAKWLADERQRKRDEEEARWNQTYTLYNSNDGVLA